LDDEDGRWLQQEGAGFWRGLGFRKEGVQRDNCLCDGEYSDFVMMSILEDEYKSEKRSRK